MALAQGSPAGLPAIVVIHQELGKSGHGHRLTLLQQGIDRVLQDVFRSRPPVIGLQIPQDADQ
jgi:hypothetical protein